MIFWAVKADPRSFEMDSIKYPKQATDTKVKIMEKLVSK
jgi:hypothetical protein